MANKYWVGNATAGNTTPASANWNGTNAWRTTSGGAITTTPPGTADVAIFDNNSFLGSSITVTISATTTVGSINAIDITTGAGGITLAGTSSLSISNGSGTGSAINLPASRFIWAHTGNVTFSGTGTVTTRETPISSAIISTAAATSITLNDNFNGNSTLTLTGGSIVVGTNQWKCTTFTSTGVTAANINSSGDGGVTVTNTSGTVINVTKTAAQLTFPSKKPIFTLSASSTPVNRGITWTGITWATSTSTMPGLKITSGSDTVTITGTASQTNYNLYSINCTGFTGTLTYTSSALNLYIFGNFIFPTGTLTTSSNIYLAATTNSNLSINLPTITLNLLSTSVYTQIGNITLLYLTMSGVFSTGSLTFNNTGIISINTLSVTGITLVGDITLGDLLTGIYTPYVNIISPITTTLTSITKIGSNSTNSILRFISTTINSGIPVTINASDTNLIVEFINTTINSTLTFNTDISGLNINGITLLLPLIVTTTSVVFDGTINIPSSSVINLNTNPLGNTYLSSISYYATFTNKFRVNLNALTLYNSYLSGTGAGELPDLYITGSGSIFFDRYGNDGSTYYTELSSLDTTNYTGSIIDRTINGLYLKNLFKQSYTNPVPIYITLIYGQTGTFTLDAKSVSDLFVNSSLQSIDIISPSLSIASIRTTAITGAINLNNCVITTRVIDFKNTVNAGTSTIICNNNDSTSYLYGGTYNFGSNTVLNNVVISGTGLHAITAKSISNISNATSPSMVSFVSNISFGEFNLNGTSGNLLNIYGSAGSGYTMTKSTPWTLANSIDGGNNTNLIFGDVGNNSYLNISYFNGVVPSTSSAFFMLF
jgi:hypothetical protein